MANRALSNGLRRHENLARVWIANPIEYLTTEEVWAYLLQKPNPWGGDNRALYRLYANASGGECPMVVDQSTPSCGNSRFGCWTCTVVERDKASEGLLASGDNRMEALINFREVLTWYRDPANGKRDERRMNGADGNGPLHIEARRELLARLLQLEKESGQSILSEEELFLIQRFWKSARNPDAGNGVARIVSEHRGIPMNENREADRLRELEDLIAAEKNINPDTLRRMLSRVADYGESHRAMGLPDELLRILQDDLAGQTKSEE
jgi:DNA sulfur modification protein DndC